MSINNVLILGAGIAGLAAALTLTKNSKIACRVFEIRPTAATIGGAVNLTPNALRCLHRLGALDKLLSRSCEVPRIDIFALRTGKPLGCIDFDKVEKFQFRARRVLRSDLLEALIETLRDAGVEITYGAKAEAISTTDDGVEVTFADGSVAQGDILLGCDGIHSFVRTAVVQPERRPVYSGMAAAYGLMQQPKLSQPLPFASSGLYSGRMGSLLLSYYDLERTKIFMAAVMETAAVESREGWKVKGANQDAVVAEILRRFGGSPVPFLEDAINGVDEWYLYPVHKLPPKGKWYEKRVLLLGDAAHAMPPQGESTGLALEDVALLSHLIERGPADSIEQLFSTFQTIRKPVIDAAFDDANLRWETAKDSGWLVGIMKEWFASLFLWFKAGSFEKNFSIDVTEGVNVPWSS